MTWTNAAPPQHRAGGVGFAILFVVGLALMAYGTIDPDRANRTVSTGGCKADPERCADIYSERQWEPGPRQLVAA